MNHLTSHCPSQEALLLSAAQSFFTSPDVKTNVSSYFFFSLPFWNLFFRQEASGQWDSPSNPWHQVSVLIQHGPECLWGLPGDRPPPTTTPCVPCFLFVEKLSPPRPEFQRANSEKWENAETKENSKVIYNNTLATKQKSGALRSFQGLEIIFWAIALHCFTDTKGPARWKLAACWWKHTDPDGLKP